MSDLQGASLSNPVRWSKKAKGELIVHVESHKVRDRATPTIPEEDTISEEARQKAAYSEWLTRSGVPN